MARINPWHLFTGCFLPNWLLRRTEVTSNAKVCYARLAQYAGQQGVAFPRQELLAEELGVSRWSIIRSLQELEEKALIEGVRRGQQKSNMYYFLYHEWMKGYVENDVLKCGFALPEVADVLHPEVADSHFLPIEENQPKRIKEIAHVQFRVPDFEEIMAYFSERGSNLEEAELFQDHYQANGWKVGPNKVKDWRATARNWIRRSGEFSKNGSSNGHSKNMTLEESAEEELKALKRLNLI